MSNSLDELKRNIATTGCFCPDELKKSSGMSPDEAHELLLNELRRIKGLRRSMGIINYFICSVTTRIPPPSPLCEQTLVSILVRLFSRKCFFVDGGDSERGEHSSAG